MRRLIFVFSFSYLILRGISHENMGIRVEMGEQTIIGYSYRNICVALKRAIVSFFPRGKKRVQSSDPKPSNSSSSLLSSRELICSGVMKDSCRNFSLTSA